MNIAGEHPGAVSGNCVEGEMERLMEANEELLKWKGEIIGFLMAWGIAKPEHDNSPKTAVNDLLRRARTKALLEAADICNAPEPECCGKQDVDVRSGERSCCGSPDLRPRTADECIAAILSECEGAYETVQRL